MLFPTRVFACFFGVVILGQVGLMRTPRWRKWFLLGASFFFYGYWSWKFAFLLALSTVVNHAAAKCIASLCVAQRREAARRCLIATVLFNLGLLGFFKYAGFLLDDVLLPLLRPLCVWAGPVALGRLVVFQDAAYPLLSRIVLPVGISFFTFQALSYVVDVYRGRTPPAQAWIDFANYLAFFPQLVAGPIVRANVLVPQMERLPAVAGTRDTARALFLILIGLFKKTVVANWLAVHLADPVFAWPEAYSAPDILVGVYAYALQIYCDFSAYSDIAIGTALLLGFRFPDNFNAPYAARSLRDFWRRWHISLSTWLRDYLYIPLGGSRCGAYCAARNLLVTFLLGGLWHGAAWTFVAWGAFHGVYLLIERWIFEWRGGQSGNVRPGNPLRLAASAVLARLWIFHVVCFSWVLFRSTDVENARGILSGLSRWHNPATDIRLWSIASVLMLLAGFGVQWFDGRRPERLIARCSHLPPWLLGALGAIVLTVILALGPEGVAPFIYFQF